MNIAKTWFVRAMRSIIVALAVGSIALAAGTAFAQSQPPPNTPPGVDHYLVYRVLNPPTFVVPVLLTDQFLERNYRTFTLDYFMIPVNKNFEGIIDTLTHYTWWRIDTHPFGALALISNQFQVEQPLNVGQPQYLLNPALKNLPVPFPIPLKNHYKLYDVIGPPPGKIVTLQDQFQHLQAYVDTAKYLGNPVQKIFNGHVDQILDPIGHLVVYRINPLPPSTIIRPVLVQDEFGIWQLELDDVVYLCVPSYKTGFVGTDKSTWGHLKGMYR